MAAGAFTSPSSVTCASICPPPCSAISSAARRAASSGSSGSTPRSKRLAASDGRRWRRAERATVTCWKVAASRITFRVVPETHEVDNNVWVLGDDTQCVVFDAPHDLKTVLDLVGGRECAGLLMTHSHDDHARLAPELATELEAPVLLNPADREVWQLTHGDLRWDDDVSDGDVFTVAGVEIQAIHTPGHSPGSTC